MTNFMSGILAPLQRMYGSMTGDSMRMGHQEADRSTTDPQCSTSRRKTVKNSPVYENGSFDADLHAAIEESLKYSTNTETNITDSGGGDNDQANVVQSNSHDDVAESSSTDTQGNGELKHLKELMILHLDLIYQQQELLLAKDREIKHLKGDREALKCRLERMERRMSLLKQSNKTPETPLKLQTVEVKQTSTEIPTPDKARYGTSDRKGFKRKLTLDDKEKSTSLRQTVRKGRQKSQSPQKSPAEHRQATPRQQNLLEDNTGDSFAKTIVENLSKKNKCNKTEETLLRTDVMYYVPPCKKHEPKKIEKAKCVVVPSWRLRTWTNAYSLEGTENLEDEVFTKRHQKPELEEKRRKRWDLQRLRDQKMYEKLEKGRYKDNIKNSNKKSEKPTKEVESILPKPENALYLEVSDKIPVSAFGLLIPDVESEEFQLPCFNKKDTQSKSKAR